MVQGLEQGQKIHDQHLERRGQIGIGHRCFALPFDEKLRKKKKYKKVKKKMQLQKENKSSNFFDPL